MMVPRAFSRSPLAANGDMKDIDEKSFVRSGSTRPDQIMRPRKPSQIPVTPPTLSESAGKAPSRPVEIPSQRSKRPTTAPIQQTINVPRTNAMGPPRLQESVQDLLAATAIPIRKRPKGRAIQKLPNCDHVADFTRLLLEDVISKSDGMMSSSLGNPQFDGLFGNIDELVEGQMFVGSEGADIGMLSPRSVSSESMPSLASPDDFLTADAGMSMPFRKSPSDRRLRQLASSEDCGSDHPLLHSSPGGISSTTSLPDLINQPATRLKRSPLNQKSTPGAFKSTLSTSLRALRSAAQTLSNIATTPPTIQPEDFLSRSIFNIQPSLTDDKRPPPSNGPPSPALRRYLNPLPPNTPPDSPTHLHFWHDDRPSTPAAQEDYKPKIKRKLKKGNSSSTTLPPIVPLQSCIPPAVRTAHASSPPIWLAPDGTPSNKRTAPPLLTQPDMPRQREPRENRDFLRVLVAEMNMQRAGKLDEKKEGKAVLWLPPIKEDVKGKRKGGAERWVWFGPGDNEGVGV